MKLILKNTYIKILTYTYTTGNGHTIYMIEHDIYISILLYISPVYLPPFDIFSTRHRGGVMTYNDSYNM